MRSRYRPKAGCSTADTIEPAPNTRPDARGTEADVLGEEQGQCRLEHRERAGAKHHGGNADHDRAHTSRSPRLTCSRTATCGARPSTTKPMHRPPTARPRQYGIRGRPIRYIHPPSVGPIMKPMVVPDITSPIDTAAFLGGIEVSDEREPDHPRNRISGSLREARREEQRQGVGHCEQHGGERQPDGARDERTAASDPIGHCTHRHGCRKNADAEGCEQEADHRRRCPGAAAQIGEHRHGNPVREVSENAATVTRTAAVVPTRGGSPWPRAQRALSSRQAQRRQGQSQRVREPMGRRSVR